MTEAVPRPIPAGIIGLSWIGADPAGEASSPALGTAPPYSHASAMAAVGGIAVRAVCDLSEAAATAFVERWGSTWPGMATFTDVGDMLAMGPELVSIVTPDHLHAGLIRRCVEAGVPMVFTEKPFTTDLAEADSLLDYIEASGTTVSVNHTWRWRPDVAEAAAVVRSGRLGPLSQVIVEAGGPRAMLFRNLSHFVDLAIHLANDEPRWVAAELEAGHEDYGTVYTGGGGADASLDPGATALIGFDGGVRAFVTGLKASTADVVVQMVCRDGRVTLDTLGARITTMARTDDSTPGGVSGPVVSPVRPRFTRSGMEAGLADLIDAHRTGSSPSGSAASARRTVAVLDAILRSQAAGSSRVAVTPRRAA